MASKLDARRQQILELLTQSPICSPLQLSAVTKVSSETIRKDLDALANEGLIIKVHGGVALASPSNNEIPFDLRATRHAREKRQIAQAAIRLIDPGDSIILESCTTNMELAKALSLKPELLETLVVITNSLAIASTFDSGHKCRRLFFLGGWVNAEQYATHGHHTSTLLQEFHASKAFLSGAALSRDLILTGYYDDDVLFQRAAITAAGQIILMLDHSKFESEAILLVTHLSAVDFLVTDRQLTQKEKEVFAEMNIRVVSA